MADTNTLAPVQTEGQIRTDVAPVQPGTTQAETTPDLSTKFAHLARKEKAFRAQQRQFQAERQAWEAQKAEIQALRERDARLTQDPFGVLIKDKGLSEEQLTSLMLNRANPQEANHIFQLQQQNKELREQIEKINKRFEDNETNSYNQALNQIGNDAKVLVNANASDFELIAAAGDDGIEAVKSLCKVMWDEDQVLISVQEAAEMVEQELLDRSLKLAGANKVKAKLSPAPLEPMKTQTIPGKPQPTTSLNSQTLQPASRPGRLTDKERRERAILAAQGKL